MSRTYENFDITLESDGPVYHARVADDLTITFGFPLEDHEIEPFVDMFGKSRTRKGTPQLDRAAAIGGRLFDTLFTEELHEKWDEAEKTARKHGNGLRLRLDLSDAHDLVTLPWEYLYEEETDSFISLSNWTPIVRHLDVHETRDPVPIDGSLKILVMISDPIERRGTLDVEREWQQLSEALEEARGAGEVDLTRLPDGQLETLQFELLENDYHVFHFIGHGEFSEVEDDGVLVMEDSRGREVHVSGRALGTHLRDSHSLRLAVLNNCEGAATSESDPFAGSAQSLLRKGIPAIVAMQFEITDRGAVDFARGFYRSLGTGLPVDAALAEARKTLRDGPTHVEFGVPVLYMSAADGTLFDKVAPPPPKGEDLPPPPPPRRGRFAGLPIWAWGAIALIAVVAVVVLASIFSDDGAVTPTTGTSASTETTAATTETTAASATTTAPAADGSFATKYEQTHRISIEGKPIVVALADNAVWVSTQEANGLSEIDPATNTAATSATIGFIADGLAIDNDGGVWVVNQTTEEVFLVDPTGGRVLDMIAVGKRPTKVAAGEGFVWVVNEGSDTVSKINATTRSVVDDYDVADRPVDVLVADGYVWVSNHGSASVSRVDPSDGSSFEIEVGDGPLGLASGFGSIWVALLDENIVVRIDPGTREVTARISVGTQPDGVAAGAGAIWVTNRADNTVSRVDPESEAISQIIPVDSRPDGITVGDGIVWVAVYGDLTVANYTGGAILRLEPVESS